ncbi:DUF7310 family coiled-coil domain-containing protein [Halegenticoccus soli]|uniref:DUF7310 family coiled-coil domain-containing protein n=1 Tax=Halegenticoccus soli TaxID=1985678 RepID=UPI000C6EE73D|nr:hypothetical protein [Halegenticoccus soli]
MDETALAERLAAVERALIGDERSVDGIADAAERDARLEELTEAVERLDDRVAELEAATMALRGYVGNVRAVNRDVERRADAALAGVEALEAARRGPTRGDEVDEFDEVVAGIRGSSGASAEGSAGSDASLDVDRSHATEGGDASTDADSVEAATDADGDGRPTNLADRLRAVL